MSALSDEAVDHKRVIACLAKKSTVPIAEVTLLYEREWVGLETGARVKCFVPILTVRRLRELLRKMRDQSTGPAELYAGGATGTVK